MEDGLSQSWPRLMTHFQAGIMSCYDDLHLSISIQVCLQWVKEIGLLMTKAHWKQLPS